MAWSDKRLLCAGKYTIELKEDTEILEIFDVSENGQEAKVRLAQVEIPITSGDISYEATYEYSEEDRLEDFINMVLDRLSTIEYHLGCSRDV